MIGLGIMGSQNGFTPLPLTLTRSASCGSICNTGCGASWASTQTPSPGSQAPCHSPGMNNSTLNTVFSNYNSHKSYYLKIHLAFEALRMKVPVQGPNPGSLCLTLLGHDGFAAH